MSKISSLLMTIRAFFSKLSGKISSSFAHIIEKHREKRDKKMRDKRLAKATEKMLNAKIANKLDVYDDFDPQKTVKENEHISYRMHKAFFLHNGLGRFDSAFNALLIKLRDKSAKARRKHKNEAGATYIDGVYVGSAFNIYDACANVLMVIPLLLRFFSFIFNKIKNFFKAFKGFMKAGENPEKGLRGFLAFFRHYWRYAVVAGVFVFVFIGIYTTFRSTVCVAVYVDGENIGIVDDVELLSAAKRDVEETITSSLGLSYKFGKSMTYKFVRYGGLTGKMTYSELYSALYDKGAEDYISAYMLYVDGRMVGAMESYNEAESLIEEVKEEKVKALNIDTETAGVTISNNVKIVNQLCLPATIVSKDSMKDILLGNADTLDVNVSILQALAARRDNVADLIDYLSKTLDLDFSTTYYFTEDIGDSFGDTEDAKLSFTVVKTETEAQQLPYKIVYEDSPYYYEGTKVLKRGGVSGKKEVVYSVSYVDGKVKDKVFVTERVVSLPTDAVYYVGTMKKPVSAPTGKLKYPLKSYVVTSEYGGRDITGEYERHSGIDLYAPYGSSIYAADGGTVIFAGVYSTYGYLTVIDHGGIQTAYAHQSEILVNVGDSVFQGQLIGKVGETGRAFGAHLHFEVRVDGVQQNPREYLAF